MSPPHPKTTRSWKQRLAGPLRWLHVYSSMFGLVAILFFSVTGFSLNNPELVFADARSERTDKGRLEAGWVRPGTEDVARLEIVEYLRKEHGVRYALEEFRIEETECSLAFRGPAYAADVTLNRESGEYELTQVSEGFLALVNDLHRGRHTGPVWPWVIDITAVTLATVSVTGLGLLLYIKRRRNTGLMLSMASLVGGLFIVWLLG